MYGDNPPVMVLDACHHRWEIQARGLVARIGQKSYGRRNRNRDPSGAQIRFNQRAGCWDTSLPNSQGLPGSPRFVGPLGGVPVFHYLAAKGGFLFPVVSVLRQQAVAPQRVLNVTPAASSETVKYGFAV